MKSLVRPRAVVAQVLRGGLLCALAWAGAAGAAEQDQGGMFAKLTPAYKDRVFMRLNYVYVNVKTDSKDAYDVTGPVLAKGDIVKYLGSGSGYASRYLSNALDNDPVTGDADSSNLYDLLIGAALDDALDADGVTGLGTPRGLKARSSSAGTPAISLGVFLDEDRKWLMEAFLLAAPLKLSVYGDGQKVTGGPNGINGKKILTTDMLPPTVLLGRYFGDKNAKFRPYLGVGASYAIFFNTKATQFLNQFQGGANPGDTTVTTKNAFGIGPFVGFQANLNDDWHASLNVGQIKLKSEATLITRNTTIETGADVLTHYGSNAAERVVEISEREFQFIDPDTGLRIGTTTATMRDLARAKGLANSGTFVRKQENKFTNTIFMLSVGRKF